MPITSWPRPCPVGIYTGNFHIGRVYGKKTCGGRDCVREWRSWSYNTQTKMTELANLTIQERLIKEQTDEREAAELAALQLAALHTEESPELPNEEPRDIRPQFLKNLDASQLNIREALNPNTMPISQKSPNSHSLSCTCEECCKNKHELKGGF